MNTNYIGKTTSKGYTIVARALYRFTEIAGHVHVDECVFGKYVWIGYIR